MAHVVVLCHLHPPHVLRWVAASRSRFANLRIQGCNRELVSKLEAMGPEFTSMRVRDKIRTAVRMRLEMVAPYIDSWPQAREEPRKVADNGPNLRDNNPIETPQALAVQAHPRNFSSSARSLLSLVDGIWRAAGDDSKDSNWYTKRALLAGVYTGTELYMLSGEFPTTLPASERRGGPMRKERGRSDSASPADGSPEFADTWEQLDRRIEDVMAAGRSHRAPHLHARAPPIRHLLARTRAQAGKAARDFQSTVGSLVLGVYERAARPR